jgi:hypothetical protein
MLGTGVPHLGHTSTRAHPLICFRPGRQGGFRLIPVHDGSLVTPVQKSRHCSPMRACRHEAPHALLVVPSGHRPEGPASIGQKAATLKTGRCLDLTQGAVSIKYEERQEANRSNSQARDTDKWHTFTPGSDHPPPNYYFRLLTSVNRILVSGARPFSAVRSDRTSQQRERKILPPRVFSATVPRRPR